MTILMVALGAKGVGVRVGVFVGGVGVSVSSTTVADGVDVASSVAGAGAQPIRASIKVIINNRIADLRFRGELLGFMILAPLPKKASRLHYSTDFIAIQAAI